MLERPVPRGPTKWPTDGGNPQQLYCRVYATLLRFNFGACPRGIPAPVLCGRSFQWGFQWSAKPDRRSADREAVPRVGAAGNVQAVGGHARSAERRACLRSPTLATAFARREGRAGQPRIDVRNIADDGFHVALIQSTWWSKMKAETAPDCFEIIGGDPCRELASQQSWRQ